jgi:hypothetical protein
MKDRVLSPNDFSTLPDAIPNESAMVKNRFIWRKGINMRINIKTRLFEAVLTGLIFAIMIFSPAIIPDAEAGSRNLGRSNIVVTGETPVHPGYPRLFDIIGTLDRLTAMKAVIDDSMYHISNSATYHVPGPRDVAGSRLHAGDMVGCLITADGEIESMWLISGNSR